MSKLTKQQELDILRYLRTTNRNYAHIAKKLSISEYSIMEVDIKHNKRFNATEDGLGPQHLRKYIVGVRNLYREPVWVDDRDRKIQRAQDAYDKGFLELCQGRDGFNMILYAIPRKDKAVRKPYFTTMEE